MKLLLTGASGFAGCHLAEALAPGADLTGTHLERPARVLAWWSSRDPREQEQLQVWWQEELEPAARREGIATWYAALGERARLAVRWPAREQLSISPASSRDRLPVQSWFARPSP